MAFFLFPALYAPLRLLSTHLCALGNSSRDMAQPGWGRRCISGPGGQASQVADPLPKLLEEPGISLLGRLTAAPG